MTTRAWIWIIAAFSALAFILYAFIGSMFDTGDAVQVALRTMPVVAFLFAVGCLGIIAAVHLCARCKATSCAVPVGALVLAAFLDMLPDGSLISHGVTFVGSLGLTIIAAFCVVNSQRLWRLGLSTALGFGLQMVALWIGCRIIESGRPIVDPLVLVFLGFGASLVIDWFRQRLQEGPPADLSVRPQRRHYTEA